MGVVLEKKWTNSHIFRNNTISSNMPCLKPEKSIRLHYHRHNKYPPVRGNLAQNACCQMLM